MARQHAAWALPLDEWKYHAHLQRPLFKPLLFFLPWALLPSHLSKTSALPLGIPPPLFLLHQS